MHRKSCGVAQFSVQNRAIWEGRFSGETAT